ncbi:capsular biosynthesis protein [Burkholderia cenocepacia]|uniref:capsular polysaccharide biosynthesis protein n=1 Tax=Burkholderia cenocepacia TaxID=95486 RepID=UPI001B912931|nr:capsular biosynthesis protein [Burkholderia cenocepacia]
MSDPACQYPGPRDPTFDLNGITRGSRLVSWLMRRSNCIWTDKCTGRLLLRLARAAGFHVHAASPGPLLAHSGRRVPLPSWFVLSCSEPAPWTLSDAINNALEADPAAGTSPHIAKLMKRVLDTHALDPKHRAPRCPPTLLEPSRTPRVLLIDERMRSALAGAPARTRRKTFESMIESARTAHPGAQFWIAHSGEYGAGPWLSSLVHTLPRGTQFVGEEYSLCATLRRVDHVYTVTAPEGMYALLAGVPVNTFGAPYYAGWGLTNDHGVMCGRTMRPTLAALFDIVFLRLARYLDPATHAPGSLDALLDSIELQRTIADRFADLREVAGVRFQWWKRPFATPFLTAGGGALRWTREPGALRPGECAALWGARSADGLPEGIRHVRIEDGFLHSTGLGSDMIAPCSQVVDTRGLYFDASRPSDLTVLLNEAVFSEEELARAAMLRAQIVQFGLTKYNLGRRKPTWQVPAGRRVALVPGQVADDASIRLGTRVISTADALLREVRARRPDAYIVYKPHPDVLSGNRNGLVDAEQLADVVDIDSDLISLIDAADEVHTLSSLAGFDALMRGKMVFTYGLPFYAGWGLTHDAVAPMPWRKRSLSLDMLTAGVLLRYPIYWDWRLQLFTTPEAVIRQLAPLAARPLARVSADCARPFLKIMRWSRNATRHLSWRWQQTMKKEAREGS